MTMTKWEEPWRRKEPEQRPRSLKRQASRKSCKFHSQQSKVFRTGDLGCDKASRGHVVRSLNAGGSILEFTLRAINGQAWCGLSRGEPRSTPWALLAARPAGDNLSSKTQIKAECSGLDSSPSSE